VDQKLAISEIVKVAEVEPAIIEATVKLIDGTTAVLRMNIFAAQSFAGQIVAMGQ
jgi:hypothetical protein